jgi:FAD/FMN-containing dehydrogenase
MGSSYDPKISALEHFLEGHPKIEYVTPNSPNYSTLRATYRLDNPAIPLAIVRPQNADDVASIIKYARTNGIKPVVRSGGHSLFGQSMVQDALIVDMRDIAYVKIDGSKTTASVGGGIIMGDLADQLTKEGLVTPVGTIPTVGFVGWSTYGGYGAFPISWSIPSFLRNPARCLLFEIFESR